MPVETIAFVARNRKISDTGAALSAEDYTGETTLQDYAYMQIKRWLEKGSLRGGDRIKEVAVAKTLDISRVPVREAALRLQSEGFLKSLPRGGFIVPRYTARDVCYLYEMREAIEGISARLAVQRASDSEIYHIKEFNDRMREIYTLKDPRDPSSFYAEHVFDLHELDNNFHRGILLAGKNPHALEFISRMSSQLISISRTHVVGGDKLDQLRKEDRTIEIHQAIVEALLERNADKAEFLLREHIRTTRAHFESLAKWMESEKSSGI